MFTITKDQLPKAVKDVPWFLQMHPKYDVETIEDLAAVHESFNGFLVTAKAEMEAILFVSWLCEHKNVVGIDASRHDTFTVYINNKKLPNGYTSAKHFMEDTMPELLQFVFKEKGII